MLSAAPEAGGYKARLQADADRLAAPPAAVSHEQVLAGLLEQVQPVDDGGIARALPSARFPQLELLVHVLDHDDRGIDHRPDRHRDAAERHDVGAQAHP